MHSKIWALQGPVLEYIYISRKSSGVLVSSNLCTECTTNQWRKNNNVRKKKEAQVNIRKVSGAFITRVYMKLLYMGFEI